MNRNLFRKKMKASAFISHTKTNSSLFSLSDMIRTGNSSKCKFGENCTFAYNQLEIDVWTMERNGKLDRDLLFETTATKLDPVNRITRLLQEYQGVFVFLCQVSGTSLCNTCHKKHASVVVCLSQSFVCQTIYTSPHIIYITHYTV